MDHTLTQLIAPYRSVSIIGMCKNAGKTTVLNAMIQACSTSNRTLALTSIGRDGESTDLVTGTQKPGIYVPEGTLIATASQLLLRHCNISREILDTTGIPTPMGEVVLCRAHSAGTVQLAGPSMTAQLARLRENLFQWGADQVIIDGALSRKTLCSRNVTDATVLCTGASYHADPRVVAEDTAYHCRLLTLPETRDEAVLQHAAQLGEFRGALFFTNEGVWTPPANLSVADALRKPERSGLRAIFFGGALTDFAVKPLLMSPVSLDGLQMIVRDSSKLLLSRDSYDKLLRRGVVLQVLENVNLVAVTMNPFSAYGHSCDPAQLKALLQEKISLPVINVMEDAI